MGVKRKLKDGLNPPAKHRYSLRSKSKCKQFELENFCSRFPHLSEDILGELDYKSLVKFKEVSKFWYKNINEQRIYCIRQIEQCTETFTEFNKEWKMVVKKTPLKILKLIEVATRTLKGNYICFIKSIMHACMKMLRFYVFHLGARLLSYSYPEAWSAWGCLRYEDQLSPLHIAAKFNLGLFKEIASKFEDKNPANSFGDTPLLCAVKNGHSDICKYIIDHVDEDKKNPANVIGYTPLHYAVMLNDLKIYQLISENLEEKNPQDEMGTTPLHVAVEFDSLDKFNFDSKTIVKKEDIGQKIAIITIRTLHEVVESKQCLINLLEKLQIPAEREKLRTLKGFH